MNAAINHNQQDNNNMGDRNIQFSNKVNSDIKNLKANSDGKDLKANSDGKNPKTNKDKNKHKHVTSNKIKSISAVNNSTKSKSISTPMRSRGFSIISIINANILEVRDIDLLQSLFSSIENQEQLPLEIYLSYYLSDIDPVKSNDSVKSNDGVKFKCDNIESKCVDINNLNILSSVGDVNSISSLSSNKDVINNVEGEINSMDKKDMKDDSDDKEVKVIKEHKDKTLTSKFNDFKSRLRSKHLPLVLILQSRKMSKFQHYLEIRNQLSQKYTDASVKDNIWLFFTDHGDLWPTRRVRIINKVITSFKLDSNSSGKTKFKSLTSQNSSSTSGSISSSSTPSNISLSSSTSSSPTASSTSSPTASSTSLSTSSSTSSSLSTPSNTSPCSSTSSSSTSSSTSSSLSTSSSTSPSSSTSSSFTSNSTSPSSTSSSTSSSPTGSNTSPSSSTSSSPTASNISSSPTPSSTSSSSTTINHPSTTSSKLAKDYRSPIFKSLENSNNDNKYLSLAIIKFTPYLILKQSAKTKRIKGLESEVEAKIHGNETVEDVCSTGEYWQYIVKLNILDEFFKCTSPTLIAHDLCELRFVYFLRTWATSAIDNLIDLKTNNKGVNKKSKDKKKNESIGIDKKDKLKINNFIIIDKEKPTYIYRFQGRKMNGFHTPSSWIDNIKLEINNDKMAKDAHVIASNVLEKKDNLIPLLVESAMICLVSFGFGFHHTHYQDPCSTKYEDPCSTKYEDPCNNYYQDPCNVDEMVEKDNENSVEKKDIQLRLNCIDCNEDPLKLIDNVIDYFCGTFLDRIDKKYNEVIDKCLMKLFDIVLPCVQRLMCEIK